MATVMQIILIIACACAVNCRFTRGRPHKLQSPPVDHQANPSQTTRDSDAVIFPSNDDAKNVAATIISIDSSIHKANTDPKVDVPLISKIVPAVEVKEVFTNPVVENIDKANDKIVNEEDKIIYPKADREVNTVGVQTDVIQDITKDNYGTVFKADDASNANRTTPDFSSRFGSTGYGNYLLVPVANNQNYQPAQTNANVPYYNYNAQGIAAQPTFANVASNIGPNQYTPNVGVSQYSNGPPNVATQTNSNAYAPVTVPNTYVINGQLYAAVTVPNNMDVMSPMYYVNPQTSAYQVQNTMPLYKLVTVDQGVSPQVNK